MEKLTWFDSDTCNRPQESERNNCAKYSKKRRNNGSQRTDIHYFVLKKMKIVEIANLRNIVSQIGLESEIMELITANESNS